MSVCQDPAHVGDRVLPYGEHAWDYRTTYRRDDARERRYETTQLRVCRVCMDRRESSIPENQGSLL